LLQFIPTPEDFAEEDGFWAEYRENLGKKELYYFPLRGNALSEPAFPHQPAAS
jgi:hypothetical protein